MDFLTEFDVKKKIWIHLTLKTSKQCTADGKLFQDVLNILEVDEIPFFCPHCGNEIHMNLDILFELMNNMFKCEECGFKIESSNYVFDYEGESWCDRRLALGI